LGTSLVPARWAIVHRCDGLDRVCPNVLFSGHLIEHFVAHFVENGPISIECATKSLNSSVFINGTERPSLKVLGTFYDGTDRTAIIEYRFPSPADAVLDICDATGRRVRQLAAEPAARGIHMASFPTRGLAAGRYSCALHTAGCSYTVPVEMLAG
jgi:hypothetical protein